MAELPAPEAGLVIHYNYLWKRESDAGRDNARYPRPCAIILATRTSEDGSVQVMVVPLTTQAPAAGDAAVPIPTRVRDHLGLTAPGWAIVDEVNTFVWPGFDLALNPDGAFSYGFIPPALHARLRDAVIAAISEGRLGRVER